MEEDENNQESESLPNETILIKRNYGFRSTIEILMFVFFLAKTLSDTVIVNLLEKSTCIVILNYDDANCTEPVSPTTEGLLQQSTANLVMARSMIEALFPSFLSLFIGPWSDTNGRIPLMLLSLAGYTMSAIMWCVLSLIPGLHPTYFLLTSIPVALGGGYVSFFLAIYCYISDITEFDKRAVRMMLLEVGCLGGVLVSSLVSPYLLHTSAHYGYTIVFATSALLLLLVYLFVFFCIPESVNIIDSERTRLWRLDHVKEVFITCFRARANHIRTIVMCLIINSVIFLIIFDGELAVLYMFTQNKFGWDLIDYTRFASFIILIAGVFGGINTWLFVFVLKFSDLPLIFLGTLCHLSKAFMQAIASSGMFLYVASFFTAFSGLISPLSRSQLSKLIPAEDLGKIFAFTAFLEATAPLAASPLYTFVYKATLDTMPNAVFWLSTGLSSICVLLIGSALVLHILSPPADVRPLLDDSAEGSPSIQA